MTAALAPKGTQCTHQLNSISPQSFCFLMGDALHHFCVRNQPGVKTYLYSSVPLPVITKWHKSQWCAPNSIEILQWVACTVGWGFLFTSFRSSLKASQKSLVSLDSLIFWCCTRWKSMQAIQTKKKSPYIFNLRPHCIVNLRFTVSSQGRKKDLRQWCIQSDVDLSRFQSNPLCIKCLIDIINIFKGSHLHCMFYTHYLQFQQ